MIDKELEKYFEETPSKDMFSSPRENAINVGFICSDADITYTQAGNILKSLKEILPQKFPFPQHYTFLLSGSISKIDKLLRVFATYHIRSYVKTLDNVLDACDRLIIIGNDVADVKTSKPVSRIAL